MKKWISLLFVTLLSFSVNAEEVEVPEEELARETTLPVFDQRRVVLNRRIVTDKRFEFGLGGGLEMNEPFYNDYMFSAMGTYNWSETSAINIQGLFWMDGLSDYGEQLKAGSAQVEPFDASKVPHAKFAVFANYQFVAYYGKISVTKKGVMNLNLFGLAGLGYINLDQVSTVGLNLGVGQNFFFTKHFGLRADLRMLIFQGPDATSQRLRAIDNPSPDSFDDRLYFTTQLGLTAIIVL